MRHPDSKTLQDYVAGSLPNEEIVRIEAHFADCDDCLAIVMEEARLDMVLGELGRVAKFCPGCGRAARENRCKQCGAARKAGDFRIDRVLVESGKGRMYLARDEQGNRVALKELIFVHAPSMRAIEEFEREAKFLKALHHPNIPRFVSSFSEGDGIDTRLYLAQEYIEGTSLQDRLAEHFFTQHEILDIGIRVLETLQYLQALSPMVIHRDIKPANLVMRADGSIAVVDFGAALVDSRTAATTGVGTYGYMPVEQLAGIVDETTDVYALGASLLHLATRREPWKVLDDLGGEKINVSRKLLRILHKMVSRSRRDRFAGAGAALRAMRRLIDRPELKVPRYAAIAAAAILTGGVATAAVSILGDDESPAQPTQPAAVIDPQPVPAPPAVDPFAPDPQPDGFIETGVAACDQLIRTYLSCDALPAQAKEAFRKGAADWARAIETGGEPARVALRDACTQAAVAAEQALRAVGCPAR